ncbi:MAG TPA: PilZ domain-containing protein [Polyangia bacterium]
MSQTQPQARAPRVNIRLSAELTVDAHRVTGTTRNLSIGGVCVEIDRPIAEGKLIGLTLFVVEDDVEAEGVRGLEMTGTVQWMAEGDRNYAVGIKFGNLSAAQSTALTNALKAVGEPAP